jgi:hypothetical protein
LKRLSPPQVVGGLLTVVVIAAVAIGMLFLGSPADARVRLLDERRVQDLASIARAVDLFWTRQARLPSSLHELRSEPGGNVRSNDPSTNNLYEYRSLQAQTYELCAQFERDSLQPDQATGDGFWSHGTGRQCFRREARKIR